MLKTAALVFLGAFLLQPISIAAPKDDILAVLHKQEADWNRSDLDAFATGYENSPDIVFMGNPIARGYEQMKERYQRTYGTPEKRGKLTFTDLEVRMLGSEYASVIGRFQLERTAAGGGPAKGYFTLIFHKSKAGWRIIQDHTS